MSSELVWPIQLGPDGGYLTVESGSAAEVQQSVGLLLATRLDERAALPEYGTSDPTYHGVEDSELMADVQRWEPRASLEVTVAQIGAAREQDVTVAVSLTRPGTA